MIFFSSNLSFIQSQITIPIPSDTTEEEHKLKEKFFDFHPNCLIIPFISVLRNKSPEIRSTALGIGGRVTLGIKKPNLFFYCDYFQEKLTEETLYINKPSTFYREKNIILELGIGASGSLEFCKGFALDGEITVPFYQRDFILTVAVGFSWTAESKLFSLGIGDLGKTNKPGLANPFVYFAVNLSEFFKKNK